MVTSKPESDNKFFTAHSNVMANLRHPIRASDLYQMSLCGLIPIQKVCDLELCLKEMHIDQEYQQMEDGTTITTISEDRIEQINEQLLKIVDWQIESDFEELNSSYDDEESDL